MCGSWTLKQEAVILKLFLRDQDREMLELWDTCSGKLLLGNINTKREIILLHWTKQKGVGDLKKNVRTLTTDMEMQNLEIFRWLGSYLAPQFPHASFRNGKVYTVDVEVDGVLLYFWIWLNDRVNFRRVFDLQTQQFLDYYTGWGHLKIKLIHSPLLSMILIHSCV